MSSFTPGPWRVDKTNALGAYGVWTDYAHPNNPNEGFPAQVCSHDIHCHVITMQERNANCQLISAAPDLLAALQNMIDIGCECYDMDMGFNGPQAIAFAEAVIAKALGTKGE